MERRLSRQYQLADELLAGRIDKPFRMFSAFVRFYRFPAHSGAKTAKVHYDAHGWVVHTITNVWGFTSPGESPSWGLFPAAGAWLDQHLWEHYAFTGDREYLKRAYPIMKESVEFYLDWLVEDPKTGKLVSGPVNSPENAFIAPDGRKATHQHGSGHGPGNNLGPVDQLFGGLQSFGHRRRSGETIGPGPGKAARTADSLGRPVDGMGPRIRRGRARATGTCRTCSACIPAGRSPCTARRIWPKRPENRSISAYLTAAGIPGGAGRGSSISSPAWKTARRPMKTWSRCLANQLCLICSTPIRHFRSTATSAARPASPKCCCKAMPAKSPCCRPGPPKPGPPAM